MDQTLIMQTLSGWLDGHLNGLGFTRTVKGDFFTRTVSDGHQAIGIAIWDYAPVFEINLVICIRLDSVEQLYHDFIGTNSDFRRDSFTIITPMNYFAGGPSQVKLSSQDDLESIIEKWQDPMRTEVMPYLEAATTVAELDDLINNTRDIMNAIDPQRAFMAHIIIAKIAQNPSFAHLVKHYRSHLEDINHSTAVYDKLIQCLSNL